MRARLLSVSKNIPILGREDRPWTASFALQALLRHNACTVHSGTEGLPVTGMGVRYSAPA